MHNSLSGTADHLNQKEKSPFRAFFYLKGALPPNPQRKRGSGSPGAYFIVYA